MTNTVAMNKPVPSLQLYDFVIVLDTYELGTVEELSDQNGVVNYLVKTLGGEFWKHNFYLREDLIRIQTERDTAKAEALK